MAGQTDRAPAFHVATRSPGLTRSSMPLPGSKARWVRMTALDLGPAKWAVVPALRPPPGQSAATPRPAGLSHGHDVIVQVGREPTLITRLTGGVVTHTTHSPVICATRKNTTFLIYQQNTSHIKREAPLGHENTTRPTWCALTTHTKPTLPAKSPDHITTDSPNLGLLVKGQSPFVHPCKPGNRPPS